MGVGAGGEKEKREGKRRGEEQEYDTSRDLLSGREEKERGEGTGTPPTVICSLQLTSLVFWILHRQHYQPGIQILIHESMRIFHIQTIRLVIFCCQVSILSYMYICIHFRSHRYSLDISPLSDQQLASNFPMLQLHLAGSFQFGVILFFPIEILFKKNY